MSARRAASGVARGEPQASAGEGSAETDGRPEGQFPGLRYRTVPVGILFKADRDAMWNLFIRYYADVTRAAFERDLRQKSSVILLYDRAEGELRGFSTIHLYRRVVQGRRVGVLFSGDTIIDQAYWGRTALQRAWLASAMRFKLANPHLPVYWFLITKGYKTYLLLSRNFPEHWPRHDRPIHPFADALIDTLARERFGNEWKPGLGIVRHSRPMGRLRSKVAPIDEESLRNPDVRYFVERNPGWTKGDELCCVGKIDLALSLNYLAKLGRRTLWKTVTRWGDFF